MSKSELWEGLSQLASNLWWSWDSEATRLFRQIDSALWEASKHSPLAILDTLGEEGTIRLLDELDLTRRAEQIIERFRDYRKRGGLLDASDLPIDPSRGPAAYFSAEYGIHESMPIYAGGLGILAGDHLKSASDLGIPMVAVGLLYREGYFTQIIDAKGRQRAFYRRNDMDRMGLRLVCDEAGRFYQLPLPGNGDDVKFCLWETWVGNVRLVLLDVGLWQNRTSDREPTQRLYGGTRDIRLRQEILLGIGGVRALRFLGIDPSVYHMNEGHCAFLGLELLREKVKAGATFDEAMTEVRRHSVFTTHTPVPAGHDRFEPAEIERHLGWLRADLGVDERTFLGLGRVRPDDPHETFCMTVLGLKLSRSANGVSALHGGVSRQMWHGLWSDRRVEDVPIGHITNGVHIPTWIAPEMADLLDNQLGPAWRARPWDAEIWSAVDDIPDSLLWALHLVLKRRLLAFAEKSVRDFGWRGKRLGPLERLFDPDALTIGFARRFATYKRGDLLFRDMARAREILANPERPIQVIFAGKAHPQDFGGGEIIRHVFEATRDSTLARHVAFLPDYGIDVARLLVQGVDVWLNTPRRPREASGTSGQKGPLNGVLNASTVDGWWCEGHDGQNGWNIGDATPFSSDWELDQRDQQALYHLLEHEIAPLYYDRDVEGMPTRWIERMKASIRTIPWRFCAERMVREYVKSVYWPEQR